MAHLKVHRNVYAALAVALVLVLVGAKLAEAVTTLTTAMFYRKDTFFDCFIVNTGPTAIKVTLQAVDPAGNVAAEFQNRTVLPGDGTELEVAPNIGASRMYCRFNLIVGNRAYVRASYCVEGGTGDQRCIATGDAY